MPDKILRVTMYSVCFGQQLRNVMHFRRLNFEPNDLGVLCTAIENSWFAQVRFLSCAGWQCYNIRAEVPNDDQLNPVDHPINGNGLAGNNEAVCLPVGGVLNIKTSDNSKRGRGRYYVPAMKLNGLLDGTWTFGTFTAMESVSESLRGSFAADSPPTGFSLGVTNKIEPQVAFKEMTDIIPRLYPGTQVRRQFHRGS